MSIFSPCGMPAPRAIRSANVIIIPPYGLWVGYLVYCVCFCSVTLFSAVTLSIGVKFGARHHHIPDRSFEILGALPPGR